MKQIGLIYAKLDRMYVIKITIHITKTGLKSIDFLEWGAYIEYERR